MLLKYQQGKDEIYDAWNESNIEKVSKTKLGNYLISLPTYGNISLSVLRNFFKNI